MRRLLKRHSDSSCPAATSVEVEISRPDANNLVLRYTLTGNMDDIRIPAVGPASRSDELWQHTCFEAFLRAPSGAGYYEFNFSPSTEWAAYRFSGYRDGMASAEISAPSIEVQSSPGRFALLASLGPGQLSDLNRKPSWRLGLSALVEDMSGQKSYWALTHPPGKPDFHHLDCFAYELSWP
jgi:hypothetical protein